MLATKGRSVLTHISCGRMVHLARAEERGSLLAHDVLSSHILLVQHFEQVASSLFAMDYP